MRPAAGTAERIEAAGARRGEGDLANPAALSVLVEGAEAVIHVAAVYRTASIPDSTIGT